MCVYIYSGECYEIKCDLQLNIDSSSLGGLLFGGKGSEEFVFLFDGLEFTMSNLR